MCVQGFLTAVLQNHARASQTPIDQLSFAFQVMQEQEADQLASPSPSGAYVSGLHLEGARWAFCGLHGSPCLCVCAYMA